jgi:stage V sporulation protein G
VEITEVRIKLMEDNNERLLAFCSITFDDMFVIRDLKIIEGGKGSFVAMPSRKLTDRCPQCGCKNHLRARYCNQCGHKLDEDRATRDADGRAKLHADIAHPINSACREVVQTAILKAYQEERERAKLPGYVSSYDDMDGDGESYSSLIGELNTSNRGQGDSYRAHAAHGPRGTHTGRHPSDHEAGAPVAAQQEESPEAESGQFGAGIL